MTSFTVVGAGIVGLATAAALARAGHRVDVVEKESSVAAHQTGRNSGVIHSGLYYAPGSLKATMCVAGNRSMHRYALEHGIAVERCGKVVIAVRPDQLGRLDALAERGAANGVRVRRIELDELHAREPHAQAVGALEVLDTGIVDYGGVSRALADEVLAAGGRLRLGERFRRAATRPGRVDIETDRAAWTSDALVNCAGLHSDRVARASGVAVSARIVPFRGEYFELSPGRRHLVKGLIYPVPDPRFPFLGVHLTRMIDGSIHAGPNAVVALAREGYDWSTVRPRDVLDWATFPGMWRLGARHLGTAVGELRRSLSPRLFARSLAELVPEITESDLERSASGVRAQAMLRDGRLVEDFLVETVERQVHVLNSPSPAATSALEIGRHLARSAEAVAG